MAKPLQTEGSCTADSIS